MADREGALTGSRRVATQRKLRKDAPMDFTEQEYALARAVLQLADIAHMPDSYWQVDSRVSLARYVLGIGENERYSREEEWSFLYHE